MTSSKKDKNGLISSKILSGRPNTTFHCPPWEIRPTKHWRKLPILVSSQLETSLMTQPTSSQPTKCSVWLMAAPLQNSLYITISSVNFLLTSGGSIVALHTERHKHIFDMIDSLEITGCFCLTELGYGNNAVMMETTATYDEAKKEFVINCPTVQSQKYWITNGAVHANMALVFAQTIVKGKN